jgi:hypothetical protein
MTPMSIKSTYIFITCALPPGHPVCSLHPEAFHRVNKRLGYGAFLSYLFSLANSGEPLHDAAFSTKFR